MNTKLSETLKTTASRFVVCISKLCLQATVETITNYQWRIDMENFDPLGIHTGDSIVVAPSQTLSDEEVCEQHMSA